MGETDLDKLAELQKFVTETDLVEWKRQQAAARAAENARERRSRAAKKVSTPTVCEKRSANAKKQFADPAHRERARAQTAALWADSVRRAQRVAQIQAYWRKRREELALARGGPSPLPLSGTRPQDHRTEVPWQDGRQVSVDGAALRALRESLGLTIRTAALQAGTTPGNLSYI